MTEIQITPLGRNTYTVEVREGSSKTVHEVTVGEDEASRYGENGSLERLLEASFKFLLEREPKESILTSFSLSVIEQYFPEYPDVIRKRLR